MNEFVYTFSVWAVCVPYRDPNGYCIDHMLKFAEFCIYK